MPYDDRDLGQHWLRWPVAWWHQAITRTSVDLSWKAFCTIHLRAISQQALKISVHKAGLKITLCKSFSGVSELRFHRGCAKEGSIHHLCTTWNNETWCTLVDGSKQIHWSHDDVIKWKHFPRYWPFVRGIHRSPVNSPHKGQWRGALMFTLICARINGWVNNREAGDLRRYRAHYDVIVMQCWVVVSLTLRNKLQFCIKIRNFL